MEVRARRGRADGKGADDMERIDTHGKRAMAKAALLVLALTLAAVVAIYAYPERLTAEASSPPSAAEATPSAPEDEGL